MKVDRATMVGRGLLNRCPNCGGNRLFRRGLTLHPACPDCGLPLERGDGFFLGSMSLNYGMTILLCLVPILLLWLVGLIAGTTAGVLCGIGAAVFPIAFYRSSRCWWLALYYVALPHELPANAPATSTQRP